MNKMFSDEEKQIINEVFGFKISTAKGKDEREKYTIILGKLNTLL